MFIPHNLCRTTTCGGTSKSYCSEECGQVGALAEELANVAQAWVAKAGRYTSQEISTSKDREDHEVLLAKVVAVKESLR